VELFVGNGLLNQHLASNHYAIDEEYFAALEQWAEGHDSSRTRVPEFE